MSEQAPITNSAESTEAVTEPVETLAAAPEVKTEEVKEEKPAEEKPVEQTQDKPLELKLPEGSKLDAKVVESTLSLAKEKGWSQEYAQGIIDARHEAVESYHSQQQDTVKALNETTWVDQLKSDPEVGGAKFEESGILAAKGVEKVFGKDKVEEIKKMNLNHLPWFFKGMVQIAKAGANDSTVIPGTESNGAPLSVEERMYPNMFKKEGA